MMKSMALGMDKMARLSAAALCYGLALKGTYRYIENDALFSRYFSFDYT